VEDDDVAGTEVEGVDEVSASVETSGVDVDSILKAREEEVTIDKVEAADGVDDSELALMIAVDTTTFVDDEDFAGAEDGFAVVDLQSPKPA